MHPIPRPRPHGPADLGVLAEDLDRLAGVHTGSRAPELETGRHTYGQVEPPVSYRGAYSATDSDTAAASDAESAGPVFVDASGRRRKVARRAGLVALAAVAGYAGLLAMSFAGGPIPPNALLPVPGMPSEKAPASSSTAQNGAATPAGSGAAEHPTTRSANPASDRRTGGRSSTAGAPGQTVPSTPQATSTGSAAPPLPTSTSTAAGTSATTSGTSHGNPTPPGRQHKSSAPSPTG